MTQQAEPDPGPVECLEVTDDSIVVRGTADRALDVLFDGRRVLSFWLQRDTTGAGAVRTYSWPTPLRRFLDGLTIPGELRGYVAVAVSEGLIEADLYFRPQDAITRGEVARAVAALQRRSIQ